MQLDLALILSWFVLGIGFCVAAGLYELHRKTDLWSIARRLSAIILVSAILLPSISDADEIAAFSYLGGRSGSSSQTGSAFSESQEDSEEQFAGFWELFEHLNLASIWSQASVSILWFLAIAAVLCRVSSRIVESAPDRAPPAFSPAL